MFNGDNKTHYKMYKAGKRWMFGAITVTMFTAGIAGGTFLSNGKSVHADTTVNATQNQISADSSADASTTDKAQSSNVQGSDAKSAPVTSNDSADQKATIKEDAVTNPASNVQANNQSKTDTAKQSVDTPKADSKENPSNQTVDANSNNQEKLDTTNQKSDITATNAQKTDTNSVDQNKIDNPNVVKLDSSAQTETINITYWDDTANTLLTGGLPLPAGNAYGIPTQVTGNVGDKNTFDLQKIINLFEEDGYDWVRTDGVNPPVFTSTNPINITVHFAHHFEYITQHDSGSLTVHYYKDALDGQKAADDKTTTVPFSRVGKKDMAQPLKIMTIVLGNGTSIDPNDPTIQWSDWTPDKGANPDVTIDSPQVTGYTPTQEFLPNNDTDTPNNVNPNSVNWKVDRGTNSVAKVVYTANQEKAQVQYFDDTLGKLIDGAPVTDLTGKYDENINVDGVKGEINTLNGKGYDYVSGLDTIPATFNFDGTTPTYTIHLNHRIDTVTENGNGSLTVHYQYSDGKPVLKDAEGNDVKDVTDNVTFHHQVKKDAVTGDTIKDSGTPWVADDGQNINVDANSPVVTGYYADQKSVSGTVAEGQNDTKVVTYNKLGNLVPNVPGGTPVPYPNDPTDPTKPGQPITPNYPGYTPLDPQGNPIKPGTPYPINPNEPGKDTPVPYVADDEQAHVNYVDQDNNNSVIKSDTLNGKFGEKADYSTKDEIAKLESEGYELVTDGYPADGYTYTTEDPTFTVVLKHKTKTVTPDNPGTPGQPVDPNNPDGPKYPAGTTDQDLVKEVTRTIHYKYADGTEASKDVVETTKFSRNATFDEVTGKVISYSDWTPANDTFGEVNSPVIDGYYTNTPEVAAETVNADATNSEVTVTYNALGHLVPDVPDSKPVIYPNNPTNPSEAGNPIIPSIPDYTPVDHNGNKLTPGTPYPIDHSQLGKDTPIHYVKNEAPVTPVTPSTPETPAKPAEKPSVPEAPAKPAAKEVPASQPAQQPESPAAAPKKDTLPQTGQDATTSLMSIIGAILIAMLGFFGLDGFKKRNEDK